MDIVFVNPEYPSPSGYDQGGIATYTYGMANACSRSGCRTYVMIKKGTIPKQLDPSVIVEEFDYAPLPSVARLTSRFINGDTAWERGFSWGLRQKLLAIHKTRPLDIVEVPEYNGLAFELFSPLPFPVVIHFHTPTILVDLYNAQKITPQHKRRHAFEAKALMHATALRCPSIALKTELCDRYGLKNDAIALLRHPFDTSFFDCIKKNPSGREYIDILFVGRLERRKGAEILRDTLGRILSLDQRVRFTFAGESTIGDMGNYRNSIERSLNGNDRERVFFLGPTKRDKLSALYCSSDIFCIPSLFENAPFSLLEAMAAKIPVVGSIAGGIPELIRHEENGLLFDPNNPEELIECIRLLIADKTRGAEFALSAYALIKSVCDPLVVARAVIDFFESTISDFNSKAVS